MLQQEENISDEREIIVNEDNTDSHVNPGEGNQQNKSVLKQPETNEPENELMADRERFTNNDDLGKFNAQ